MKRMIGFRKCVAALLGASAMVFAAGDVVVGQEPGEGAPPPPPPPGRPFPPPFRGPGGPMGLSVTRIPVDVLASKLGLSSEQTNKIQAIVRRLDEERRTAMPPRPGGGGPGDTPPLPPDPEQMRARFEKMRELEQKATGEIEALLTAEQKQRLPGVLNDLRVLARNGIPLELAVALRLTDDQMQRLRELAPPTRPGERGGGGGSGPRPEGPGPDRPRGPGGPGGGPGGPPPPRPFRSNHEKAMAVLTQEQREMVEKFRREHPRPRRGGPGFPPPPGPPPGG